MVGRRTAQEVFEDLFEAPPAPPPRGVHMILTELPMSASRVRATLVTVFSSPSGPASGPRRSHGGCGSPCFARQMGVRSPDPSAAFRRLDNDPGCFGDGRPAPAPSSWRIWPHQIACRATDPQHQRGRSRTAIVNRGRTIKRVHRESYDRVRTHLADVVAHTVARSLKTLSGLMLCDYICEIRTVEQCRCVLKQFHRMLG